MLSILLVLKFKGFLKRILLGRSTQGTLLVYDDIRGSLKIPINPYHTRRCIMLKHKALMESASSNLHSFLKNIGKTYNCRTKNSCETVS